MILYEKRYNELREHAKVLIEHLKENCAYSFSMNVNGYTISVSPIENETNKKKNSDKEDYLKWQDSFDDSHETAEKK